MKSLELLDIIKNAVSYTKNTGQTTIHLDALESYLGQLTADVEEIEKGEKQLSEAELKNWELEHKGVLTKFEAEQQSALEMFRSVILTGQSALKSTMLINGGAAVALLAFLGKLSTDVSTKQISNFLTLSLLLFAFGVLSGALATATTYFSQLAYSSFKMKTGITFHIITVLFAVASFVFFGVGAFKAYSGFVQ